jgi:ATP-dependent RNA helicase DHX36
LEDKRKNNKYMEILAIRTVLPAFQMRDQIVKTILDNRVVVVSGDTGCGKTTQIPQLVLDAAIDKGNGGEVNIVVTQPRRISAISVAERIAQERAETVGQTAGYHIKLEKKKSVKTRVLLMTTGVLLRRLQMEGDLVGTVYI